MFQDMGLVPNELFESFRRKALDRLGKALASGDYLGWLVSQRDAPQKIIAGAGVIIREVPPFPTRHKNAQITIAESKRYCFPLAGVQMHALEALQRAQRGSGNPVMCQVQLGDFISFFAAYIGQVNRDGHRSVRGNILLIDV